MDQNQDNHGNTDPQEPNAQKVTDSTELEDKIQELIKKGLSDQDVRTRDLLLNEINTKAQPNPPANETLTQATEKPLPKWLQKFNTWHRANMSDFVFLLWLSVFVGLFAGFAAHIFNRLISISSEIFLRHIRDGRINWWLIFIPIIGLVLSGIYTRYVVHTNLTHSVTRLMHSIYKGKFLLKRNLIYSPIIGGTITLGMGGSAGSEGPIAVAGAAIGSNIGRWLQLKMPMVKVLVGCGAAAGISGIFQSPVGGLLFTLEFLKMEIGTLSILGVTLASLVAYGIVFVCNGCKIPTEFFAGGSLEPDQYFAVILLGVFCGLYSMYYSWVINQSDKIFIKIKNPWLTNMAGGLTNGVALLLFPALFGVGYPVMSDVIHSHFDALSAGDVLNGMHIGPWGLMIVALCILAIKCWACGACNASGGVSSDFAPTLYAGAIAGFLFSLFCNTALHTHFSIPVFTLLGMAAVMAGCIESPMMTIFIVLNMGTDFAFALALIIVAYSSYIIVRVCSRIRGYDNKLVRHLEFFHAHQNDAQAANVSLQDGGK